MTHKHLKNQNPKRSPLAWVGGKSQLTQANLDPNKQIADIQSMVSGGVNVLIVAPVNPQAHKWTIHRKL